MNIKASILFLIVLIAFTITFFFVEPIPQNPSYHQFADTRATLGIPNTFDVLSNVAFIIVGMWGIAFTAKRLKKNGFDAPFFQYLIFFTAVFLTGFGSSYYHYAPSNRTLIWDRLPMAIAFMGFFCSVVSEVISLKVSMILIGPLLMLGLGSVVYWGWSEECGWGDLRLYGLVQFLPMILILSILFMYKLPSNYLRFVVVLMFLFLISKITEFFDRQIFEWLQFISGHTLKHLFVAAGTYCVLQMLFVREN
jgi:hypothetical protein